MSGTQAAEEISSAAEQVFDNLEKKPLHQQIGIGAASGL